MAEMNWNMRELKREDYLDIASRNNLSPVRAEQYTQFMLHRMPKESSPQYATEWAQRFAKEDAYCKGDHESRNVLWEVGYFPQNKGSSDYEVVSADDKRWIAPETQHERNVNLLVTLLRFMPQQYVISTMEDFNLASIDNVDSLREALLSRNPQEVYIVLRAIEDIYAKNHEAKKQVIQLAHFDTLDLTKPVKVSEHGRRIKGGATRVRRHSREKPASQLEANKELMRKACMPHRIPKGGPNRPFRYSEKKKEWSM